MLDVSLRRQDRRVANEVLSQDYILGLFIEVRYLRCSKVVAHDFLPMLRVELTDLLGPLVSRILPISRRKHDVGVRCTYLGLECFDGIDRPLVNCDRASARLLGFNAQLDVAIIIRFGLRDGAKGQTDCVLYT